MQVDRSHRGDLVIYDKVDYDALADRCVSGLSSFQEVVSVVVCGSLAKGDLVPGWSDIDIIVFLSCDMKNITILDHIQAAIEASKGKMMVGVGLDIVYVEQFLSTHKLCGRPYQMTYEVARYGQLRYGSNFFEDITYDERAKARVEDERYQLIASEVHSWRRDYINQKRLAQQEKSWIFTCAKALLRILQLETGPNLTPPISSTGSLERFLAENPRHPAIPAFVSSVEIRRRWSEFLQAPANHFHPDVLEEALNSYPLRLPQI